MSKDIDNIIDSESEDSFIENNEDTEQQELTSDKGTKKSGTKIGLLMLIFLGFICLILFCGWEFWLKRIISFNVEDSDEKVVRQWQPAPSEIGNLAPPVIEIPEPPKPEPKKEEPKPELVVEEKTAEPEEEKPDPMKELNNRRWQSQVKAYTNKEERREQPQQVEQKKEVVQSRQVKLINNIDFTMIKGTKIPCTVETTIISEQQGFTSCVITQDVYSGNGRVILVEKGTKATGEYRGGTVKNGDRRLQIIWDRLITPHDIAIQLDSPSTDRLGASGITGKVDNRWFQRIGSALLVSLISDTFEILGDKNESAEVYVDSDTADTSQDIATTILNNNINLPPIIYIKEGQVINIYVADDIDFSSVYKVRALANGQPQQITLPRRFD